MEYDAAAKDSDNGDVVHNRNPWNAAGSWETAAPPGLE
jgi:hypothetical protein